MIRLRHGKTPYELLHNKPPDLSYLHVFGALCYPMNDSENLGNSLGPALHEMTPATISSGLVPNPPPSTPFVPPSRTDWDILFQPLFDELFNPPPSVDFPAPEVIALIDEVSSSRTRLFQTEDHMILKCNMGNDLYFGIQIPEVSSDQSSSSDIIHTIVPPDHQPDGFVIKITPNHLYKLKKKALYGLKQAPRAWYDMLSSFLISQDFSKGSVDPTLFIRREGKELLLVQIYVDDIIFAASTPELCDLFAKIIPRGIFINQSKYALESLKKYGFDSCDLVDTPMVEKSKLDEDKEGKAVDPSHYRGMIGTLLYLTASRPDLQFAICMCARYQARPTKKHLNAKVEAILKSDWTEKDQIDNFLKERRFYTSAGNPVKEILLKLNLPDHRILKDGGEVLKLKNFKKDATLKLSKLTNQEWYEHVGPEVTRSQDDKVTRWQNKIMLG
ncbi:retrovirus-related pol polyprotein from transposon TNT 1-94 [Tanacetum coccineum]